MRGYLMAGLGMLGTVTAFITAVLLVRSSYVDWRAGRRGRIEP